MGKARNLAAISRVYGLDSAISSPSRGSPTCLSGSATTPRSGDNGVRGVPPEAPGGMIVDNPGRLHPRVYDDRADKLESAFFQRRRDLFRQGSLGGNFSGVVANGRAAGHAPDEGREVLAAGRHL